jgi:small-conductance mechanosensitive channel
VQLAAAGDWIHRRAVSTTQALASSPSANALGNLTDSWQLMRSRLAALNDALTARATTVQQRIEQLDAMRATWVATRTNAEQSSAPTTVLARIDDTTAAISVARRAADARLAHVLELQDRAVKDIARCDTVLARIAQTQDALGGAILSRDALPIWSPAARALISGDLGQRLREAVRDGGDVVRDFIAGHLVRVPVQLGLLVVVFVLARQAARRRADKGPSEAAAAQIFEWPFCSALVVTLIATVWIYPHPPRAVISAVALFVLFPAVTIVRRLVSPALVPAVYALATFCLVDRVRDVCSAVPVLEQWVLLFEMVSGIVFLALVARSRHFLMTSREAALEWRHVVSWILWGELVLLVVAVFAGSLGHMRLARLLGSAVLTSNYVALVLYAGVRVGEGLLAYALRASPLRAMGLVQRHQALLQHRLTLGLRWLCAALWAYFTLDALGMIDAIWTAAAAVLDARFVRGSVSVSLGDVVTFALTVGAAFLVSALVRFVLREDVYPHFALPRGAAYALSTIVHYLVVLAGLIFAIAALGIDLTRITILAGALGVGLGIGLQHAVANFVSGLILLLEQRLHVGDSIQLGDLQGQIRDIGGRATTIRTWDGGDVIVPNATLTSERVTNWTLTDLLRRVELNVGVSYAAHPGRVLEILGNAARTHPKALADPVPLALCTGFGDSALQFKLRVWTRLEDAELLLSDLAIRVHAALSAAEIEIPCPQRDVRIRNAAGRRSHDRPEDQAIATAPPAATRPTLG